MTFETKLVTLLKARDQELIPLVYEHYAANVYGVIIKSIPNSKDAQEVLQDVFLKMWKSSHTYNSEKGRFYTWLMQITRTTIIDKVRSGQYQRALKLTAYSEHHSDDLNLSTQIKHKDSGLWNIICRLPSEHFELINLLYFQSYSHTEAAKHLNLPLGTVKSRIRSALKNLRSVLNKEQMDLNVRI